MKIPDKRQGSILNNEAEIESSRIKIRSFGLNTLKDSGLLDKIYPIGTIYDTSTADNPSDLFGGVWNDLGGGSWERTG